jgi:hypothetical protein
MISKLLWLFLFGRPRREGLVTTPQIAAVAALQGVSVAEGQMIPLLLRHLERHHPRCWLAAVLQ